MLPTLQHTKKQRKLNRSVLSFLRNKTSQHTSADYPIPPVEWLVMPNNNEKTLNPESALGIALSAHQSNIRQLIKIVETLDGKYSRRGMTWENVQNYINEQVQFLTTGGNDQLVTIQTSNRITRYNCAEELAQAFATTGSRPWEICNIQRLVKQMRKDSKKTTEDPLSFSKKIEKHKSNYDTMSPQYVQEQFLPKGEAIGVEIEWLAPAYETENDNGDAYYDQNTMDFIYPTKGHLRDGTASQYIYGTSWGYDSSIGNIADHQYRSGQEVRVMLKYGKWKRLYDVCDYIKRNGGEINKTCGLHVHLDARDLSKYAASTRAKRLASALPWLLELVPKSRRDNRYCRPQYSNHTKYSAITTHNFNRSKTIEVRLHSATLNASKIVQWVNLLWYIKERYNHINTFEEFLSSDAPIEMKEWVINRRAKFNPPIEVEPETESEQLSELPPPMDDDDNNNEPLLT